MDHFKSVKNRVLYNENRKRKRDAVKSKLKEKIMKQEEESNRTIKKKDGSNSITISIQYDGREAQILFQRDLIDAQNNGYEIFLSLKRRIGEQRGEDDAENGDFVRKFIKQETTSHTFGAESSLRAEDEQLFLCKMN